MRIFLKYSLLLVFAISLGGGIISSCQSTEVPSPDKATAEYYIMAEINGEKKIFLSKIGYSILIPASPIPTLILRANEGYAKIREVPGFELNLSFQNFPPAPGVYSPNYSEQNFIQYYFMHKGVVKTASSKKKGTRTKIILKEVIPYGSGYILEGSFFGKVHATENNSSWEFDLRNGKFRVYAGFS